MTTQKNELLSYRLVDILTRLNSGEELDLDELARVHQTSMRTIQRDLNDRFSFLPFERVNGKYRLEKSYLGHLGFQDIRNFATLAGVSGLFPSLDRNSIRQLLDSRTSVTYASKGQFFEDVAQFKPLFVLLETAITAQQQISFNYKGNRRPVEPYKLVHHHNCWYLAAVHDGKLKAYRVSRIEDIVIHSELSSFTIDSKIVAQLNSEQSIWFGKEKEEVILKIDGKVASHFLSRQLLPEQQILRELDNGGLIVSSHMVNSMQILPLVRYWLPHIHIVSPEVLKHELEQELRIYLGG